MSLNRQNACSKAVVSTLDSGNDSFDKIHLCFHPETSCDFIIKRNLRQEALEMWREIAKEKGVITRLRDGKTIYTGSVYWYVDGLDQRVRIVFQVIEQTSLANGQLLLIPELEADTWRASLTHFEEKVIELSLFKTTPPPPAGFPTRPGRP
ncbi:MAG: hypothetical protein K6U80_09595 [Firmicutes bacterium]|nr:hypothetical protein [Bacillota bacterium]